MENLFQHQPGSRSPVAVPMSGVMVRKDKPPDYNSVIMMKEREDEELPNYCQAVSSVSEGISSDEAYIDPSESRTECDDNDSDIKTKNKGVLRGNRSVQILNLVITSFQLTSRQ